MIVVIDNYDSFVHNLARYFRVSGEETLVIRNDACTVKEIIALEPSALVLSPGPATPNEAGICCDLIKAVASIPLLGVCLGHQCLADVYGGRTVKAQEPMHGRSSDIIHKNKSIFAGLPNPMAVGRYHSLIATLGDDSPLQVTAWSQPVSCDPEIMSVHHRTLPHIGVQFHPESVLSPEGLTLIQNFITIAHKFNHAKRLLKESS